MDEQNNSEETPWEAAEPVPADTPVEAPSPAAAAAKPRLRDRAYGVKSLAAVALAGLVLGAAGGAGISAVAGHDDGHRDGDRDRVFPLMPPGQQGQFPPGGPPQQVQPDSDSDDGTAG